MNKGIISFLLLFSRVCLCKHKCRQRSHMKKTMAFPLPAVEYHDDNTEDQDDDDEESGSSDPPTTTTSPDGSISDRSDDNVMIPLQTVPDGEARHVPVLSRDALPFRLNQFDSEVVREQHESRTSDNRDREDMKNKVHTFLTEPNNHERDNANFLNNNESFHS